MLYAGCILCCARYRGDGRTYLVCCETRYFQPISCLSLLPWFYHYPCLFTEYGLNVRSVNSSINHNTINYAIPSLHLCFQYIYIWFLNHIYKYQGLWNWFWWWYPSSESIHMPLQKPVLSWYLKEEESIKICWFKEQ